MRANNQFQLSMKGMNDKAIITRVLRAQLDEARRAREEVAGERGVMARELEVL